MAFKKFYASKDNTITNAFRFNGSTRATGSNMGLADALEVFKVYGEVTTSSVELSRVLIQFDTSQIINARTNDDIPASGSVDFFLNMYNARHPFTVPRNSTMVVQPVTRAWNEGSGMDMDEYKDLGKSNWISASTTAGQEWTTEGGDVSSIYDVSASFLNGPEDLSINVSNVVERWVAGTLSNYGYLVSLTASLEGDSDTHYTKKFFARSSEYFFKRPTIEARWNSSTKDQRGDFYASSSLLSTENVQEIYMYNYFRGDLKNIPTIQGGPIYVQLFTSASGGENLSSAVSVNYPVTGGHVETGIYSASFDLDTTASVVYDRWYQGASPALSTCFHTGTLTLKQHDAQNNSKREPLVLNITNLRDSYSRRETNTRVRLYTRKRNWSPNIYSVAKNKIENYLVDNMFYKVTRKIDNSDVVSYGTGSIKYTLLSYDASGSYFDFNFSNLESGYAYEFKFIIKEGTNYNEYPEGFRFRVED